MKLTLKSAKKKVQRPEGAAMKRMVTVVTATFFVFFFATVGVTSWFIASTLTKISETHRVAATGTGGKSEAVNSALFTKITDAYAKKISSDAKLAPAGRNPFKKKGAVPPAGGGQAEPAPGIVQ